MKLMNKIIKLIEDEGFELDLGFIKEEGKETVDEQIPKKHKLPTLPNDENIPHDGSNGDS